MRLVVWTALAMVAFAANSVLNRVAVGGGLMDPAGFAVIRLAAGAAMLALLVAIRYRFAAGAVWPGVEGRLTGVAGLLIYLFGFSAAYLALGAGVGALILVLAVGLRFAVGVQITHQQQGGRLDRRGRVQARKWRRAWRISCKVLR